MNSNSVADGSARYGFDAPGVMIGLIECAAAGFGLGFALRYLFVGQILSWLSLLIFTGAGVIGVLGLSMLLYGLVGKLRVRDFMVDSLALKGNEQVLDIGTGRGLLAIGIAKKLNTGKVIGIDMWSAKDLTGNTIETLAPTRQSKACRIGLMCKPLMHRHCTSVMRSSMPSCRNL